jgi:hypothetical protein
MPWYLRILYILPILLCIAVTLYIIIEYTTVKPAIEEATIPGTLAPSSEPGAETLDEEARRGEKILQEYEKQQENLE